MRKIAKIVLKFGENRLFSIKREPWSPAKDNKLELLGGGIDAGETPFEALTRELYEEEASGTLGAKAAGQHLEPRQVIVMNEPHFIYEMTIDQDDINRIRMDDGESRGCRIIHHSEIIDDPRRFTPKTIAIFRALGMV